MSEYTVVATEFVDIEALAGALEDLGLEYEVGTNLPLYDWLGDLRPQTADVVVRREEVNRKLSGGASNDLGFKINPLTGKIEVIVSDYDVERNYHVEQMLAQPYALRVVQKIAWANGWTIEQQVEENGKIGLRLTKWA